MSGKTSVSVPPPTSQELALQERQIKLADLQIAEIQRQSALQQKAFEQFAPLVEAQEAELVRQQERAAKFEAFEEELLQLQLEAIRRGGAATEEQKRLINEATEGALASGETDIERFTTDTTRRLREELSTSFGLRPSDSPILDRASLIGTEATRQFGQLSSGLRTAQAQAELDFPLATQQVLGAQAQFQQGLSQSVQEFNQQLRDAAFINRLNLTNSQGRLGLGLATGIPGNPSQAISALAGLRGRQTTTTTSPGFGEIAGGIGGFLTGLGAVI